MDNDLDLTALRGFRTVLRDGSFSAAALALRVPKSTLSKRVADLEADLGVRLIERSTRTLRPTQEGEVLAARERSRAAPTFAAAGLYLSGVEYDAALTLPRGGVTPFE